MADSKLSALTEKTTLADDDLLYLVDEDGSPTDRKITGANLKSQVIASVHTTAPTLPTSAKYETAPRYLSNNTAQTIASGTLYMVAIYLGAGDAITSVSFVSGATAGVNLTHQWFAIYDDHLGTSSGAAYAKLAATDDDTNAAWGSSTVKTLNLTSTYNPVRSGLHYLGVLLTASTTVPNLVNQTGGTWTTGILVAPVMCGRWNTGLPATSLPDPATLTATLTSGMIYGYVS